MNKQDRASGGPPLLGGAGNVVTRGYMAARLIALELGPVLKWVERYFIAEMRGTTFLCRTDLQNQQKP